MTLVLESIFLPPIEVRSELTVERAAGQRD